MRWFSPTLGRLQRLVRLFREVHEQTGSRLSALAYTSRIVAIKALLAISQARQVAKRNGVMREIGAARESLGGSALLVGVRVSGGLGDFLVVARFLRDLTHFAGDFAFDIYSSDPGRAQWVFGAVDGLRACHDDMLFEYTLSEYDLSARISQFLVFYDHTARWQRVRPRVRLVQAMATAMRFRPQIEIFIKHHPYLDGFLAQKAVYANRNRANFLHHMAGIPYGGDQLDIAIAADETARHGLMPRQYITVHNGFDAAFVIKSQRATKCYPHFGAVIDMLKKKWPALRYVQIGTSTSEPIAEVDLNLVGRTSMRQTAGLIKNARLHLDNEGGLVHLARSLGITSCVVFGPTPSTYFGYEGNINIEPTFCGGCWWINETWMSQCPRGFATARCMTEQDPRVVAMAIDGYLSERPQPAGASDPIEDVAGASNVRAG